MALIGLDEIEWDKLSHAYGSAEDIPDLLRALDTVRTKEEFDKHYRELVVRVNHQGDIYDSIAPAIRFLLQILDETEDAEKRLEILFHFGSILRDLQAYPLAFFQNPADCSVVLFRNNLATYDAIKMGLESYLLGIADENEDMHLASLYILFALKEQYNEILPRLVQTIDNVDDQWFQACIVWTYANIARYEKYGHQRTIYNQQLNNWLEHKNALVRYAAAFGKLRLYMPSPKGNELAVKTIAEALKANTWETCKANLYKSKEPDSGHKLIIYLELTPFRNPIYLISASSRMPDLWIAILEQLNPDPIQAHVCIGEILKLVFAVRNAEDSFPKWTNFDELDIGRLAVTYRYEVKPERYDTSRPLTKTQHGALKAVVDCEPFWEIPTNLFSFFYGLPNNREELRNLAEGK